MSSSQFEAAMLRTAKRILRPVVPLPARIWLVSRFDRLKRRRDHRREKAAQARLVQSWIEHRSLKLHLGCGHTYLPGYLNIDYFDPSRADRQWKLNDLKLPDACCERAESYAVMEHLSFIEFFECLDECHRVLVDGGWLIFEIPEFEEYIRLWLAQDQDTRWSFEWFSPIWGGQWHDGQFHKAGYSFDYARRILESVGFTDITRKPPTQNYPPCVMQRIECRKASRSAAATAEAVRARAAMFDRWGHVDAATRLRRRYGID